MKKLGPFASARPGTDKVRISDRVQPNHGAAIALLTPSRRSVRVGVIINGREYSVVLSAEGASTLAHEIFAMSKAVSASDDASEMLHAAFEEGQP